MHKHAIIVVRASGQRHQGVGHAFRSRRTADCEKLDSITAPVNRLPLAVSRCHNDEDAIDARIGQHRCNRVLEHSARSQAQILLRNVVTHTDANACSRNQRYISKCLGHEGLARECVWIGSYNSDRLRQLA